jgi:hypothetical protein
MVGVVGDRGAAELHLQLGGSAQRNHLAIEPWLERPWPF